MFIDLGTVEWQYSNSDGNQKRSFFMCKSTFIHIHCWWYYLIITGPYTHSVGGQTGNGRWRLLSVTLPVGVWVVRQPTLPNGPVMLRPVRATPCW